MYPRVGKGEKKDPEKGALAISWLLPTLASSISCHSLDSFPWTLVTAPLVSVLSVCIGWRAPLSLEAASCFFAIANP